MQRKSTKIGDKSLNINSFPANKRAGVSLHITSLPGPFGIGELGQNALRFVDKLAGMGIGVWQFLPTGPTAYGDSPYQPLSTFAGNENLIDVQDLIELGLIEAKDAAALRELPHECVDYGALIPAKQAIVSLAASRFAERAPAALKADFDRFVDAHETDWLNDYAIFRILKEQHDLRPWPEWERRYVYREEAALNDVAGSNAARIETIKVMQFLFFKQWAAMKTYANEHRIRLFGDMPIYIALDSSDAWANREMLRLDEAGRPEAVAGVPPDYFSEDGQLWGNPLYDWQKHADNGFSWWIDRVTATAELADIVRIDHFRGFESYWAVPADAPTARDGAWEPGVGDEFLTALKGSLGSLPIVAEDLGVITPEVEALRDRYEIPGMRVLQFDVADPDFRMEDISENSVCYTGTHDNDTTLGWFLGSPGDIRSPEEIQRTQQMALAITGGAPETIATDMIRLAFSAASQLAVAPMQDYLGLGSEARIHVPGTSKDNWRWRVTDSQLSPEVCDNVAELVTASGRSL